MFAVASDEVQSAKLHDEIIETQIDIFSKLGLHFKVRYIRVMTLVRLLSQFVNHKALALLGVVWGIIEEPSLSVREKSHCS